MGKTVAELDRTLTAEEFDYWLAFDALDPIGGYRQDVNFAQLCALIANINRGRDTSAFELDQFTLFKRSMVDPVMSNDEIAANLALIFKRNP